MPIKDICSASGLASARASDVERMLEAGQACGMFERRSELGWAPVKVHDFTDLALMLEATSLYRQEVHEEHNTVDVVLTRPPRPCKLEEALDAAGYASAILENTAEVFTNMAVLARERFVVMTPFLDEQGAKQLVELSRQLMQLKARPLCGVICLAGFPPARE